MSPPPWILDYVLLVHCYSSFCCCDNFRCKHSGICYFWFIIIFVEILRSWPVYFLKKKLALSLLIIDWLMGDLVLFLFVSFTDWTRRPANAFALITYQSMHDLILPHLLLLGL
jgi:hypothetical protein